MDYVNDHLFITIPINQKGYEEYNRMIDESENQITYLLSFVEYKKLIDAGVFLVPERRYPDLYITDGESNTITSEQLKNVYDDINVIPGVFMEAVNKAIELGTCVFLDF